MVFLRFLTAYVFGILLYMIAAVIDVLGHVGGIEALIGLPIQFVIGSIFIAAMIGAVLIIGLPLRLSPICRWSRCRLALCAICVLAGIVSLVMSRHPANLITVPHPELGNAFPIRVGNPTLSITGLALLMFGIVNAWLPTAEETR